MLDYVGYLNPQFPYKEPARRCLLATFLRDLETVADPKGPAPPEQRGALQTLEASSELGLGSRVSGLGFRV